MRSTDAAKGAALALAAAVLFGIADAVAGGVFDRVSPGRVSQVRSITAVVVLVPMAIRMGALRPTDWRASTGKLAVLGANLAGVMFVFYWAIDLLGVGPAATIHFLGPTLVLIWFVVVRGIAVRPLVWAAALASVIGVGLVTEAWTLEASDLPALGIGLLAAVLFASYLLIGEHVASEFEPVHVAVWGFGFASIIWLVALPLWTFPTDIGVGGWRDLAIIGVMGTAVPFLTEFKALRLLASSIVGVIATAEPVIAAVIAVFLLDQKLSVVQWAGVVVVVLAVAVVQRWGLPEAHDTPPVVS
jgi:inner membrane transporter RhtA